MYESSVEFNKESCGWLGHTRSDVVQLKPVGHPRSPCCAVLILKHHMTHDHDDKNMVVVSYRKAIDISPLGKWCKRAALQPKNPHRSRT